MQYAGLALVVETTAVAVARVVTVFGGFLALGTPYF
jgi:hypothetical protein